MVPILAKYPELNTIASSVFLNLAISDSNFECKLEVPVTNLEPPVPFPYFFIAEITEFVIFASVVKPR